MNELKFATVNEALQHLADIADSTVKIADTSSQNIPPDEYQFGANPRMAYERLKEIKESEEEVNPAVVKFLEDKVARDGSASLDYSMMALKERFKKGEKAILRDPNMAFAYIKGLLKLKKESSDTTKKIDLNITQAMLNAASKNPQYSRQLSQDDNIDDVDGRLVPAKVASIKFASENEALQHLSDLTGKFIKIASEFVVIHDLNNDTSYEITSPEEAKDKTDKSAAEEAFKSKDVVTMGKVVAEYKIASESKNDIQFVYDIAKGKNVDIAADAISYFIFGNKDDDNPFFKGFYKLRYTDDKKACDEAYIAASQYLLNVENQVSNVIEEKDQKELLDIMKELQKELDDILNVKTAAESLLYKIINPKEFQKLKDEVDEQTFKLAQKTMIKLAQELKLTNNQQEALNRLQMSISGHIKGDAMHRNNIFKAAHALGIELPSSSF